MKNFIPAAHVIVAACIFCGCAKSIFPSPYVRLQRPSDRPWASSDTSETVRLLVASREYDPTYDWLLDSAGAGEPFKAALYSDGKKVREVPSPRAQFVDSTGLWCDEGDRVTLNGIFQWTKPTAATTVWIHAPWAAETSSDGTWSLRRNGQITLTASGFPGELYLDEGVAYCSCVEYFAGVRQFHLVSGNRKNLITGYPDVLDARMEGGKLCVLGLTGFGQCVLSVGGRETPVTVPGGGRILSGTIHGPGLLGFLCEKPGGGVSEILTDPHGNLKAMADGGTIFPLGQDGDHVVLGPDGRVSGSFRGERFEVGFPVTAFSRACICLSDKGPILALTPRQGEPCIWTMEGTTPYPVHGYLCGAALTVSK